MKIEYLSDRPDFLPTLAQWHYQEWSAEAGQFGGGSHRSIARLVWTREDSAHGDRTFRGQTARLGQPDRTSRLVSKRKDSPPANGCFYHVSLTTAARSMKVADFRRIALSMPEAIESEHMAHPDFRVGGKIFATLGYPDEEHGMVILPPEEQARLVRGYAKVFAPAKGAWGRSGSTLVRLELIDRATLQSVVEIAWRKRAPKRLLLKASG